MGMEYDYKTLDNKLKLESEVIVTHALKDLLFIEESEVWKFELNRQRWKLFK